MQMDAFRIPSNEGIGRLHVQSFRRILDNGKATPFHVTPSNHLPSERPENSTLARPSSERPFSPPPGVAL